MLPKRWEIVGYDRPTAVELYRQGFNALVAVVLASRGIRSREEFERFYAQGDTLSEPMDLTDMPRAVERIRTAIRRGEKIAVFGDYDVDGMTACTLLAHELRALGAAVITYIPERLTEGYGLNIQALDALQEAGAKLVITVDCGVTAVEEADYALKIGLELIVTDHHQPGEELPRAVAVVDPKRDGEDNPCRDLAGVGVAYKLAAALLGPEEEPALRARCADLLALGTVADVMPVLGENRVLIREGLENMRREPRPGVKALLKAAGVGPERLGATAVGFTLAPRLNAAGRLGETRTAVRLLAAEDEAEAERLAERLCELNRQRQTIESEVLEEAMKQLPPEPDGPLVVAGRNWHQGVAGIVASKLSDLTRYPVVVICVKDGMGHGSCRASGDFSLVEALNEAGDLLENHGGHQMAAGLTIREENIPRLREKLRESYVRQGCARYSPSITVDFEVTHGAILAQENVEGLRLLAPYGSGNPLPLLLMRRARVDMATPLRGGKAIKLWLHWDGEGFEGILFGRNPLDREIREGELLDVLFTPNINEFRGRRSVQLIIKDLELSQDGE